MILGILILAAISAGILLFILGRTQATQKPVTITPHLVIGGPSGPGLIFLDDEMSTLLKRRDELRMRWAKDQVRAEITQFEEGFAKDLFMKGTEK